MTNDTINFCTVPQHDSCKGFTCDNGICISDDYECDGTDDCDDNSDEEDCSSSQHSGKDDCDDNSDEEDCSSSQHSGKPGHM